MNKRRLRSTLDGAVLAGLAASGLLTAASVSAQDTNAPTALKPTVVTGSYIESEDAAGQLNVTVLDMASPVNIGQPTLADTLRVRLLQYAGGTGIVNPGFGNGGDGSSQISLRGLPPNATLTLVNGRRTSTSDLNLIPEAAIDRIEVVNDGASAIYGSDAVAGVVNIILKSEFDGLQFGTYYANTTDKDAGQFKMNAMLGNRTENSRFVVSVEYDTQNALMSRDRDRSINTPNQVSLTSNPGLFWNNAPGSGNTAIRWNLVPGREAALTDPSQIPSGFNPIATFPSSATAAEFAAEVARLNSLLPANSPVVYSEVMPGTKTQVPPKVPNPLGIDFDNGFPFPYYTTGYRPHERYAGYFSGGHKIFGENLEFFVDGFYAHNNSQLNLAPSPLSGSRYVVPSGNFWYNTVFPDAAATGTPMRFSYRTVELGPRVTDTDFADVNFAAGFKGRIAESTWHWTTAFTYDRTQIDETQTGGIIFGNFAPALADTTSGAYNPFGYTPLFGQSTANPVELLEGLMGTAYTKQVSTLQGWNARANGEIFDLPGGALSAAVGTEFRRETLDYEPDYALNTGLIGPYNVAQELHAVRDSWAGFGELMVPIFGNEFKFPGVHSLSASAALRYEDYSDVGDTGVKPRVSFRWEPLEKQNIAVRGSYSQGFIAPGFFDLYQEPGQDFIEVYNPLTGLREQPENAVYTIGNPALKPIEAETWMIGATWEPDFLKGFSVGIDYYKIKQDGIPFQSAQYVVNQWAAAGGNANLTNPYGANASPSAANPLGAQVLTDDQGVITQINNVGPINTGVRTTDGIDFNVAQKLPTDFGTFTVSGAFTRILSFDQEDFPGAGSMDYLGRFWGPGAVLDNTGFPMWRANLTLDWQWKRFLAAIGWNFVSGYDEDTTAQDFAAADSEIREVDNYMTFDLRVGYRIPWMEADFLAGVNNLFDEEPPLVVSSFENNYDRRVADLRGRMFFLSLNKKF
jgi:iron complex outermembrane receptor protein